MAAVTIGKLRPEAGHAPDADTRWCADYLRGDAGEALSVLDLPATDAGELLPHQVDGFGCITGGCTATVPVRTEGSAQLIVALASALQLLTRAEGNLVVGVEGSGPFLGGDVLARPVPLKVPFPNSLEGSSRSSLSAVAREVEETMRVAVGQHGPGIGTLAEIGKLLGEACPRSAHHHSIFQVLVAFEGRGTKGKPDAFPLTRAACEPGCPDPAPLALVLVVRAEAPLGVLKFRLAYSRRFVSKSFASSTLRHLCRLLELPASEWKRAADELPLADSEEWQKVLKHWSAGPRESLERFTLDDGGDLCIHELFEHRRKGDPFAKAITSGEVDGVPTVLTYAAMDAWACSLALELRRRGVGRGDLVALLFERCPAMVVAIYAVLKAGGCYCPCDHAWPADRLLSVLEGGAARVALCDAKLEHRLSTATAELQLQVISVKDDDAPLWADAEKSVNHEQLGTDRPTSADPCYVFFTSGSTGKPKGVVVEHNGLVHRVRWLQHDYQLSPSQSALLKHAYTFGLSEWEIFWPLSYGASVVTCTPGAERDPAYMVRLCQRHHVPTFVFVPSALQAFLESCEEVGGASQDRIAAMAKQIIACGEPLQPNTVHLAHRVLTTVRVDNVFGPTEGEMTRYTCPKGRPMSSVPVGKPIDGSIVYVLGSAGQVCGVDVPGELMYGGAYIARGYLNQPELTAEKFVTDPFMHGGRMYKSGDVVRWRGDGKLMFVGRADHQVKIRGFRIELGDIEAAIRGAGSSDVSEVVVVVDASRGMGSERLLAYVGTGSASEAGPEAGLLEQHLLAECTKRLPAYMVPTAVCVSAKLPRNANGKVDRRALHPPLQRQASGELKEANDVADEDLSKTEQQVRLVWSEVLKAEPRSISPVDSFFAGLGGNSLLAGRVTAQLRRRFGIDLPGTAMYTNPTIKRLAHQVDSLVLEKRQNAGSEDADVAPRKVIDVGYKGHACTSPLALAWQLFGILVVEMCEDLGPRAFPYIAIGWTYYHYGLRWWLLASLPAIFLAEIAWTVASAVVFKWLVLGRLRPGSYPLWGCQYLRWWFVDRMLEGAHNTVGFLAETPLLTTYYRLLGARIDRRKFAGQPTRLDHPKMLTPDLVELGPGVNCSAHVTISCASVYSGMLHVSEVKIEEGCELSPGSYVSPGSHLPPGTQLLPMATSSGHLGSLPGMTVPCNQFRGEESRRRDEEESAECFWRQQHLLRLLVGLPWLGWIFITPNLVTILLLECIWGLCQALLSPEVAWPVYWFLLTPPVITFGYSGCLLVNVILQKRLVVGRLGPGLVIGPPGSCSFDDAAWKQAHWNSFRRWLHERSVTSHVFEHTLDALVNSELLSCVHRQLGAKVGRRVQSDNFKVVDHDCVEIEDFAVFGSCVEMNCDAPIANEPWRRELKPIRLLRASNCLDHCLVMPGVVVGEAAVLGTRTLAHAGACFPPDSISTGAISGRSVLLRTEASLSTPPKDRALELLTMRKIESPLHWGAFNCAQVGSAFVAYSLPNSAWVLASSALQATMMFLEPEVHDAILSEGIDTDFELGSSLPLSLYLAVWIGCFCIVEIGLLLCCVVMKWAVIGRFSDTNHPFFSSFHYRWTIMLNFKGAMSPLSHLLSGTAFNIWFYRAMGAKVGENAYLDGIALEYDLLEVGDRAAINADCDATAHTVERMVLKMAYVRVGEDSAMLPGSVVMPGALLEPGALLLERSQVLKGDVVRTGEVYAGQPAQRVVGSHCSRPVGISGPTKPGEWNGSEEDSLLGP